MAKILQGDANQSTPPPSVLTADGFLKFFSKKVESVRRAKGGHRPPEILFAAVTSLSNFRAVPIPFQQQFLKNASMICSHF